jgi:hypothetical protein
MPLSSLSSRAVCYTLPVVCVCVQTHAHVNTMHAEHIRFRMSSNACTHTCALAHLSTYVVTRARARARTHTHTHTHAACKHPLSISLLSLSHTHTQTHTHTQHTTRLFASFISYHYITYTSRYYLHTNQHTRTSTHRRGGGSGFRESPPPWEGGAGLEKVS